MCLCFGMCVGIGIGFERQAGTSSSGETIAALPTLPPLVCQSVHHTRPTQQSRAAQVANEGLITNDSLLSHNVSFPI